MTSWAIHNMECPDWGNTFPEVRTSSLWAHTDRLPSAESLFTKSYVRKCFHDVCLIGIFFWLEFFIICGSIGVLAVYWTFFQNQVLKGWAHFYGESWIRPCSRSIHSLPLLPSPTEFRGGTGVSLVPCPFRRVGYKGGGGVWYLVGVALTHFLPDHKSGWYASHWNAFLL